MPALLTAVVITCAAMKGAEQPKACTVNIYHGAYVEPVACRQTAQELAIEFEQNLIANGGITRTQSYGECVAAADDEQTVKYLPAFMKQDMGAVSAKVVHFDLVDGVAVERIKEKEPIKKAVKGASI